MNQISSHAIVITALPVEFSAVVEHLHNIKEVEHPAGTLYEVGQFTSENQEWNVAVIQTGMGNPNAALETERAITFFQPSDVIFVGVAGGLKDVNLGDVVAATKVYGFEYGKAEQQFKPRPGFGESTYPLLQRAQAVSRRANWIERIKGNQTINSSPRTFVGPIAAGEKVVASTQSPLYKLLQKNFSDALAVEMEGFGFFRAIHANHQVQALMVRGISDLIDQKTEADASGSQEIASRHAAAFAFQVLAEIDSKTDTDTKPNNLSSEAKADEWYKHLLKLASGLYPKGPEDRQVWSRAGGEIAKLDLGSTGDINWYNALRVLKFGGGGNSITPSSLVQTMQEDYEKNQLLKQLIDELATLP